MLWITLCTPLKQISGALVCVLTWCGVCAGGSTPPLWTFLRWTSAHEWTRSISWQATSSPCLTCPTPSKCLLRMALERVQEAIPSPSPRYPVSGEIVSLYGDVPFPFECCHNQWDSSTRKHHRSTKPGARKTDKMFSFFYFFVFFRQASSTASIFYDGCHMKQQHLQWAVHSPIALSQVWHPTKRKALSNYICTRQVWLPFGHHFLHLYTCTNKQ